MLEELHKGERYTVFLMLSARGCSEIQKLVASAHPDEQRQFLARLRRLADVGPETTPHYSMVHSTGGIWKITASKHLRIWGFRDGDHFILTNAQFKTHRELKKEDRQYLQRAKDLHQKYYDEKRLES